MIPRAPSTRRLHMWGETRVAQATPRTRLTMPASLRKVKIHAHRAAANVGENSHGPRDAPRSLDHALDMRTGRNAFSRVSGQVHRANLWVWAPILPQLSEQL